MINKTKYFIKYSLLLIPLFLANTVHAVYYLGYFNGVWVERADAELSLTALSDSRGYRFNGEEVRYHPFYNQTAGKFADIQETFQQLADQTDPSARLSRMMEYAWEMMNGACDNDKSNIAKLNKEFPGISGFCNKLKKAYKDITDKGYERGLSDNQITAADYEEHNGFLAVNNAAGIKWIFVAHSQGNLFANQAYEFMTFAKGASNVRVFHVAPPTSILYGKYILNSNDIVISLLRRGSTPASNVIIQSAIDSSGHEFLATYYSIDTKSVYIGDYFKDIVSNPYPSGPVPSRQIVNESIDHAMRSF